MAAINIRTYVYIYMYAYKRAVLYVIYGIVLDQFYLSFTHVLVFSFQVYITHIYRVCISGIYIYKSIFVIITTSF